MPNETTTGVDALERAVAEAIWSEHHYSWAEPNKGFLAQEHPDDIERAIRQARAAIAAMPKAEVAGDVVEQIANILADHRVEADTSWLAIAREIAALEALGSNAKDRP